MLEVIAVNDEKSLGNRYRVFSNYINDRMIQQKVARGMVDETYDFGLHGLIFIRDGFTRGMNFWRENVTGRRLRFRKRHGLE